MAPQQTPVNEALDLLKRGMSNEEISRQLERKGYNLQQISDAINQAQIKQGVEGELPDLQEAPQQEELDIPFPEQGEDAGAGQETVQQQYAMPPQPAIGYEEMQALVEQIVEEKWRDMMHDVGNIGLFKARVTDDLEAVKQELLRTQKRLEDLQVAVLGKVRDYSQSMQAVGSDIKALEQVLSKILQPLTSNVKELSRITEELKKKK